MTIRLANLSALLKPTESISTE